MDTEELRDVINNTKSLKDVFDDNWLGKILSKDSNNHPIKNLLKRDKKTCEITILELDKSITACLKILEEDSYKVDKRKIIFSKLKDSKGFLNYLPEFEWISYLNDVSNSVTIEPTYPDKGYDIEVGLGRQIAFEVLSFLDSETGRKRDVITDEFFKLIKTIPSSFHVMIQILNEITMEDDVHFLKKYIKGKVLEFEEANVTVPSTFYYFDKNDIREWKNFNGIDLPDDINQNYGKYPLYLEGHKAKIEFTLINTGEHHSGTIVGVVSKATSSREDERLKEIIKDKINQLPNDIPSVVIVNVLSPFLDSFSIYNAIFGQFQTNLIIDKLSGKIVKEYDSRTANGVFNHSTRISAVVVYKKFIDSNGVRFFRDVYRNPKAKNPISDKEAQLIGNIVN